MEPLPRPSKTGALPSVCPPSFAAVAKLQEPSGQETPCSATTGSFSFTFPGGIAAGQ